MKTLIHPCLWFDDQAQEAARFYVSVFPESRIGAVTRYGRQMHKPEGSVMTVDFSLHGQPYTAINGGPLFAFTPAVSFFVNCHTQHEVDHYWDALSADPDKERCGWLVDKYGVSWQIVPQELMGMMQHPDTKRRERVTAALMGMKKIDIARLQQVFDDATTTTTTTDKETQS